MIKNKVCLFALSALALSGGAALVAAPVSAPFPNASIQTFPVGKAPVGIASDGENIWVANSGDNTISKLRQSDGMVLGTFAVGITPTGVIFDGTAIWVANFNSESLMKIRPSDAVVVDVVPADGAGYGIAFDGANMWVGVNFPDEIIKVRASDDVLLGTFPVVNQPVAALFDGVSIYFSSFNDSTVTRLQLSDGAVLATFQAATIPKPWPSTAKVCGWPMGTMTGSRGSSPRTARRRSRWATPRSGCSMTARACGSRMRSRTR